MITQMIAIGLVVAVAHGLDSDDVARLQDRLERAIKLCTDDEKAVSARLDVARQARWDEMKRGRRALSLYRFAILNPEIWRVFCALTILEDGEPLLFRQTDQVRASLRAFQHRRRRIA